MFEDGIYRVMPVARNIQNIPAFLLSLTSGANPNHELARRSADY